MLNQISLIDLAVPLFLAVREGLEAVLVVIIILLYLKKTQKKIYYKFVYLGIILAVISSIIFSILFNLLLGGFSGLAEEVFEGFTFVISGIFIVTLILWISREGPKIRETIENKIEVSISTQKILSITSLTYVIIIREGIELVLLLTGTSSVGSLNQIDVVIGAIIGLTIAIIIGIVIFFGFRSINLSRFFKATNLILILFAAGLITYGIHEFIEGGVINPIIEEVWNIKHILPETFPDGNTATPEFLEIIGSLLRALFGYNANPALLEVIIYPILLISIGLISLYIWRRSNK